MRRSSYVIAPILASVAVALSGCHHTEPERCVDEQNHVVDPKFCADLPPNSTGILSGDSHGARPPYSGQHHYRHYFGGIGPMGLGSIVSGGGYAPQAGRSYSFSSGTSRGGFGSSFSSYGSSSGGGE